MNVFVPVAALALYTLGIGALAGFHRVRAGIRGRTVIDDYRFGESPNVPNDVRIPNRNLMNLLELPALFYVAAIVAHLTGHVDALLLTLSWIYVALRLVHSLVHLTYNKVLHRVVPYASSNLVLSVIWLRLLVALL